MDSCVGDVAAAITRAGGAMFLTADHGNCETMVDPDTHGPHTAHTTNLVPTMLLGAPDSLTQGRRELRTGKLADVAPTLLALMGVDQPKAMTGVPLFIDADDGTTRNTAAE